MGMSKKNSQEHVEVMFRVKRGLCGYVSYLAACEMNESFSEYILYEPILRIMTARGFEVKCEYECPGIIQPGTGDKKRLDFYAKGKKSNLAIEVKWVTSNRINLNSDIEKLNAVCSMEKSTKPLLLLFGRKSLIEKIHTLLPSNKFKEAGKAVYADLRKTKFGCRVFKLGGTT